MIIMMERELWQHHKDNLKEILKMDNLMVMGNFFGKMVLFIVETIIKEKDKEMVNFLIVKTQVYQEAFGKKEF